MAGAMGRAMTFNNVMLVVIASILLAILVLGVIAGKK